MNRIFILLLACVMICQPAFSQRGKKKGNDEEKPKATLRVLHMDKQLQMDSNSFVYALPRTIFRVCVVVERDVYTPGPYAAYADKYLGVAKVATAGKTRYTVKSAKVEAYNESDPGQLYMVQHSENSQRFDFLKMTRDGLMLLPDNFSQPTGNKSRTYVSDMGMPMFTNVGVESMFREVKTYAAAATTDTADGEEEEEVAPVVTNVTIQAKSLEERASEAAQLLLNLRKRKYELLTGDIDAVFNSNDALKVAVNELKQMERECLALFVGKHTKMRATYYYDVVPTSESDSNPVFKFSEDSGVQNLEGQGRVVTLELQPENKYESVDIAPALQDDNAFKVRMPDIAQVRLLDDNNEMYKGRYVVYQNGKIVNVRMEHFLRTE